MNNQLDDLANLPFEKLFQLAQERFNQFLYQDAEVYYQLAYQKKPYHQGIVLCYAHILKLNEKQNQAQQILIKSLKQNPNGTYKRYFQLAELYQQQKSIQIFQEGIKAAEKCLQNPFLSTAPQQQIKKNIAQAAASIAGIYLHDMININFQLLQQKCKYILQKGKKMDPNCMDLRLQIANYFYQLDKNKQAFQQLMLFKNNIIEQKQQYEVQLVIQCGKQFLQINQPKNSLQIFQKIYEDQSDNPQILYYMAGCNFQLQKYQQCMDLLQLYPKKGINNEQINEGVKILKNKLNQKLKLKKIVDDTEQCVDDQDDWQDMIDQIDQ